MSRRWKPSSPAGEPSDHAQRRAAPSAAHVGPGSGGGVEHPAAAEALKKRLRRTVLHAIRIDTLQEPPEHLLAPLARRGAHGVAGGTAYRGEARPSDRSAGAGGAPRTLQGLSRPDHCGHAASRGLSHGTGKPWRTHRVACVRYPYRLPHVPKEHDWLTLEQAAAQLGVSATVIRRLIAQGTLPASQVVPSAPWIIYASDLKLLAVETAVLAVQVGRPPASDLASQPCRPGFPAGRRRIRRERLRIRVAPSWGQERSDGCRPSLTTPEAYFAMVGGRCKADPWQDHKESPELAAALPSAKGNISHSLRRLEPGLDRDDPHARGENRKRHLTAAGRQKALKLAGSYE